MFGTNYFLKGILMKKLFYILAICGLIWSNAAVATGVVAPQPEKPHDVQTAENGFDYKVLLSELETIENELKANQFTRQSLEETSDFLTQQDILLDVAIKEIEKNSKYAQDALKALGEAPTDGTTEDESIAELRTKYNTSMSGYKNRIIEANLLKTEIARINALVSEARSHILIGNLIAEKNMIIVPHTFFSAISDAVVFFWDVTLSPFAWYRGLTDKEKDSVAANAWYVLMIIGIALSLGLFLRQYIMRKWEIGRASCRERV